jgi:PAS domain S-box-containing protein
MMADHRMGIVKESSMHQQNTAIVDPQRLAALCASRLLDSPAEPAFDRITQLAAKLLAVPVALISLVDEDRQFFKSCVGLPEPWNAQRETPLTHSFCKLVVNTGEPLVIEDARTDPRVVGNLAIRDLNVIAYLGAPLITTEGHVLGALCAIDGVPRQWTADQQRTMTDLAAFVMAEVGAHRAAAAEQAMHEASEQLHLQEAESRFFTEYRFLADAMPQMVWTAKPDGNLDYYNQRWFDYTGLTFDQMKDWGWSQSMHPDDLKHATQVWLASVTSGQPFEGEFRFRRHDGEYRWHLGRAVAMRDADGKILRWVGTTTDIHDQKMTRTALQKAHDQLEVRVRERTADLMRQQQFLEAVLDNHGDGIIACDKDGKLTLFNRALRETVGDFEPLAPEDWSKSYTLYEPDGTTLLPTEKRPLLRALRGEKIIDEQVLVGIKGSAGRRRMLASGRNITDPDGTTIGAVLSVHDITERAEAENKFRLLFDQSSDAHLLLGDNGIIDCNPAAVKLMGCRDKQQMLSIHPAVFSPEFQPDGTRSAEKCKIMDATAHANGSHRFEWIHRRLDGVDVSVEVTLTSVELDGSKVLLVVWHDLTDQKLAESKLRSAYSSLADANLALRKSEERFNTFMDYSPAAAYIKDESSRFVYVNRMFATICRSTPEQMIGRTHFDFQSEETGRIVLAGDQEVLRGQRPIEVEAKPPFPSGEEGRWHMLKFPLGASNGGRLIGGIAFDVSAAKKAEAEIARQKQYIEAVIEHATDGILACDAQGNITCFNRAIRRMQGIEAAPEQVNREWFLNELALYDPVTGQKLAWEQRPLIRALRNERVDDAELLVQPRNGQALTVLISASPITDKNGTIIGAVAAWHDVTDLRRSQKELLTAKETADAANQAKSEFLANMSHEIRTPMTAILGYTDLLADPTQSPSQRAQHVQVVRKNGQHLLQLLSDILDLSKIEAREMKLEMLEFSPTDLLYEIESLMRPHATGKNISLTAAVLSRLPDTIVSDPTRLKQILLNLVGNAIKFTEHGGVKISVSQEHTPTGKMLRFDVSDSGIGITPQQQANLFRPFRQADGSTTRKFGGTGLGLAICKRLAHMLDGELTVTSEAGKGSTFSILLAVHEPLARRETQTPLRANPTKSVESIRLIGRILVAEDGIDNQRLVRLYLEAAGVQVETAANGRIAIETLVSAANAGKPFDAVLMDMQMPELDGYGATAQLRKAGYTEIPIIAFTAHALATERETCIRAGCTDYVTKPIDRANLLQVLSKYIPQDQTTPATRLLRSDKATDPLISTILDSYIQGLPEQISKVTQLLSRSDIRGLRQVLHQLKGSGGSYGFPEISTRARCAEAAITGKEPLDRIAAEVNALVDLIRRVDGYDQTLETPKSDASTATGPAASAAGVAAVGVGTE